MPTTRLTWSEWIATNPPSAAAWATQNELDAAIISGGGAVTAADTVTVTLMNHTGGNVNLDSGTLTARIWKSLY